MDDSIVFNPPGGFPWENYGNTPLLIAPPEIEWGDVDVPEETKKAAYTWVLYGILAAITKHEPIDAMWLPHAFVTMYRDMFVHCNQVWYKFTAPFWEEAKDETDDAFLFELRTSFKINVLNPIIRYLETLPTPPVQPRVWEYKKKLLKSNKLSNVFKGVAQVMKQLLCWESKLGSNMHLIGFKCGHVYDTKIGEFR